MGASWLPAGAPRPSAAPARRPRAGRAGARPRSPARRPAPAAEAAVPSVSIKAKRPGCSDWAERRRPQSAAAARSGDSSVADRPLAPWVTRARRSSRPRGSSASQRLDRLQGAPGGLAGRPRGAGLARLRARSGIDARTSPADGSLRLGHGHLQLCPAQGGRASGPWRRGLQPAWSTARTSREPTARTGAPCSSAAVSAPLLAVRATAAPAATRRRERQRDPAPGEGQLSCLRRSPRMPPADPACRAASSSAGWIAKRAAASALLLGQRDLGVDLLAERARRR